MTKVDFYILPNPGLAERQMFICRLLNKLAGSQQCVFIRTASQNHAAELDEFIWANKPEWFLPHQLFEPAATQDHSQEPAAQVEIGYADENESCGAHHDVLINLAPGIPSYFSSFQRLIEVVSQDQDVLEQTRVNFKFYRNRNYPIETHHL